MASFGQPSIELRLDPDAEPDELASGRLVPSIRAMRLGGGLGHAICFGMLVLLRKCLIADEQCL